MLYEEQWAESVEYLVSNGVTIKSELAREIFEEIWKSCRTVGIYGVHCFIIDDIMKLEKKYTEEVEI